MADNEEQNGDYRIVKSIAASTDFDLTPQKSTDSGNNQDVDELGRHAEGTIQADTKPP